MTTTECKQESFGFQDVGGRAVVAKFDGGRVTSDAGSLLFREAASRFGILKRFAECFTDHRDPERIEFTVEELVSQRVCGLICGYEDLNDHDTLRVDPVLAAFVGREDITGKDREKERDKGKPLAGKSTLNRIELSKRTYEGEQEKYKKIICDESKVSEFLLQIFIATQKKRRRKVRLLILDLDATDTPLHGGQEGRHYHGYYNNYCYLPLYIFCDDIPLAAKLRSSNIDGSAGSVEELEKVVPTLQREFPDAKILVRADSGFAREEIMRFCEENHIDFLFGLAGNSRLISEIEAELAEAKAKFEETKQPSRVFKEFQYQTLTTWSKERRVIGKAEHLEKGSNPRFVVTSLTKKESRAMRLYEKWYCKRGEMENRIKEQFCLFADRMSAGVKRANQLRLWFSAVAYLIMTLTRKFVLRNTALANAQVDTIRTKLIKIGARVTVSVRRMYVSMASSFPLQETFSIACSNVLRI